MPQLEAAESGNLLKVQQCLARGTPAATADPNGHTALHKCAFMGFESIAKVLLDSDPACAHACDLMRNVPLHAAAFSDNVGISRCLLAAKADVDPRDAAGNTPLHRATLEGNCDVAELLLAHGADANAAGSEQNTPLHFLVLGAPEEPEAVADLLLRHGASPHQTNRFRRSPIDLARFQGQRHVVRCLLARGGGGGGSESGEAASPASFSPLPSREPSLDRASPATPTSGATARPSRFTVQPPEAAFEAEVPRAPLALHAAAPPPVAAEAASPGRPPRTQLAFPAQHMAQEPDLFVLLLHALQAGRASADRHSARVAAARAPRSSPQPPRGAPLTGPAAGAAAGASLPRARGRLSHAARAALRAERRRRVLLGAHRSAREVCRARHLAH